MKDSFTKRWNIFREHLSDASTDISKVRLNSEVLNWAESNQMDEEKREEGVDEHGVE